MKLPVRHLLWWIIITVTGSLLLSGCDQSSTTPNGNQPITNPIQTASSTQVQTTQPASKVIATTQILPTSPTTPKTVSSSQAQSQSTGANPAISSAPKLNISQFLQPVADIPLPGSTSRFDYQSLDPKAGLLFIAHLGDSSLIVFDIKANKVISEIKGVGGVHGVLVVPELGRVYATATSDHQLAVIVENSLKIIARVPAGSYPDGLAYAPGVHKLYISDEGSNAEPVIDIQTNKALPSISLGGEAGNTQYDPVSQHIFVDVQSRNELVEINPPSDGVISHYPLPNCQNDHGLQLDPAQRLAFIACDGNAKLLILDMQESMKVLSIQDVGNGPDVLALDTEKRLLYVACESSTISVFNTVRPTFQKLAEGMLSGGGHTIAIDTSTHHVFLPLQEVNGKPTLRIMQPA
jgi:DNA-binding beta-propeller fold protein YncE